MSDRLRVLLAVGALTGALLISLGVMHFFNMYLFFRIRRRSQLAVLPPPVAPQMRLPMPSVADPSWARANGQPVHAST